MSSHPSPRVGTRFGKYQIVTMLGRGGMGEVYEALDTEKGRAVALKILSDHFSKDDAYRRRFTREAHAAAQLQEPHVIPIHDWGEIDGSLYIDMRLVRGTDLRKLLDAGPLAPARAVSIVGQVAAALDAAHAGHLIHRDVKPENVVVTADDFAYLVDFGIAERSGDVRLTQTGMTLGSMPYIAPERLSDQPTTAAADIYSLACVLYETLTGQSPFGSTSTGQLLTSHLYSPPPRPSASTGVPATFDAVVARGMAKTPAQRYASAGELARAASRALTGPTGPIPGSDATMAAPHVMAVTDFHTQAAPYVPTPPTQPAYWQNPPQQPPQQAQHAPGQGKGWVVPTVIATCAALLLCVVGVTLVVLNNQEPQDNRIASTGAANPQSSAEATDTGSAGGATATTTARTTTTTSRALVPPPIVTGPDANQQSCDDGIAYPGASGQWSRSARGTQETTCLFARNVLYAYWEAGQPSTAPRTVYALGAVDCRTTTGRCSGEKFVMECTTLVSNDWITCTGGTNARVYIY